MIQEEAGSIQQNFWMMDTWNEEEKNSRQSLLIYNRLAGFDLNWNNQRESFDVRFWVLYKNPNSDEIVP